MSCRLTGERFTLKLPAEPLAPGIKASLKRSHKLNTGYQLRVDIEDGTTVRVYLNGSANPVLSHRFVVNSSGRVGYRTEGAKSLFDNAAVWTDFVLQ